jgi:hypothetical protein
VEETNPRSNKRLSLLPNDKNRETHLLTKIKEKEKVKRKVCKPGQEGKKKHEKRNEEDEKRQAKRSKKKKGITSINQAHSHSAKTHHLALRSASTRPLHVPLSPILMTVSQAVVKPTSVSSPARLPYSCLRVNRMIFWLGLWMASLAGFCCAAVIAPPPFGLLPLLSEPLCETDAVPETMLMALAGRTMPIGFGLGGQVGPAPQVSGVKRERLDGC